MVAGTHRPMGLMYRLNLHCSLLASIRPVTGDLTADRHCTRPHLARAYEELLTPYAKEIIGDHQCGFRRNRSTIDRIFCIRQILEKKWEYNEEDHQLFIDFKKTYDSVRREVSYKILIEFGIPKKLVRLIRRV